MKLSEIVDFNPRTPMPRSGDIPFIDMAALPTSARGVSNIGKRAVGSSGAKFANGDTLLARITPCLENGKGAKVSGLPGAGVGQGSTEFIVMRAKQSSDENFTYYISRHPSFRSFAIQQMSGTSGRQRVSWQPLADYEIDDLSVHDRREVGAVLSGLDDKIELNRRMNATLEGMAQAIFRDWFVDFGPVRRKLAGATDPITILGGLIPDATSAAEFAALFPDEIEGNGCPEGWSVSPLGQLIEFNPRESISKGAQAPYTDMASVPTKGSIAEKPIFREFSSGMKFRNGDALLARITPCLENGKAAFVDFLPASHPVGWGSTEFIVMRARANRAKPIAYLVSRWPEFRAAAIQSMTGTSGRQRANAEALQRFEFVHAPDAVHEAFGQIIVPMFDKISHGGAENRTLAQTRDYLLPRLMSGKIRVAEAEAIAA